MSKNRILYNTQGLFLAPYSGESLGSINNARILKRIERVQDCEYSINSARLAVDAFGSTQSVYQGLAHSPEVALSFSYIPDGLTNENRLNLSVGHVDKPQMELMFSEICKSKTLDQKDFYLVVNKNESDINTSEPITSQAIDPALESDIINRDSKNYGLLHFQNCYLRRYSFQTSIDSLPIVRQEYIADNLSFYLSGSGVSYTKLDTKSGQLNLQTDKIIIPKNFSYTDPNLDGQNILSPRNANISFETKATTGSNFYTENLQSFRFNVNFQRRDIRSLNHKFVVERPISFPLTVEIQADLLITGNLSGNFFNTLDEDAPYNLVVSFDSDGSDVSPTKFVFSGCRFNNIAYRSDTKESKTASLSFISDVDSNFGSRGIFASGSVLHAVTTGLLGLESNIYYTLSGTEDGIQYDILYDGKTILNY